MGRDSVAHGDAAISVTDLSKSYGPRRVLDGLTFDVRRGEVFALLGPNGAGKTTTVEILEGYRSRDGGDVRVLGIDPSRGGAILHSQVGLMLQEGGLYPGLRVGEALRLFARLAGDTVDWRELAAAWRLEPLLGKPFGTLSGGQRQRLFLALALVNRPRLVFLDELTQGLDPAARRETWGLVRRARDQGATVVLVTHDMEEAERLCDRIAVLDEGRLLTCGRPAELVAAAGAVRVRFSSPSAVALGGLERVPGVAQIGFDGAIAEITADPHAVVGVAAELSRRELPAADFTVIRPSLEDAVVSLLDGGHR
jgi:ABC-2 type transport system ATP-binding protein